MCKATTCQIKPHQVFTELWASLPTYLFYSVLFSCQTGLCKLELLFKFANEFTVNWLDQGRMTGDGG